MPILKPTCGDLAAVRDINTLSMFTMCVDKNDMQQVVYKNYKGKEGTRALENHYEKIQARLESDQYSFLRCPTCMEVCTGLKYSEWVQSDAPAHLSPCQFVTFDAGEPPALFVDEQASGEEEEEVAGGRLKKKRPSFLEPFQALSDETPQEFLSKLNLVASSASAVDGEAARKFNQEIFARRPVYRCSAEEWARINELASAALLESQAQGLSELEIASSASSQRPAIIAASESSRKRKSDDDDFDVWDFC